MRVSLHDVDGYTDAQIKCILYTLKATKASKAGKNLITAK